MVNGQVCGLSAQAVRDLVRRSRCREVRLGRRLEHGTVSDFPGPGTGSAALGAHVCGHGLVVARLRRVPSYPTRDYLRVSPRRVAILRMSHPAFVAVAISDRSENVSPRRAIWASSPRTPAGRGCRCDAMAQSVRYGKFLL